MNQFNSNSSQGMDTGRSEPETMSLMGISRADGLTEAEQLELSSGSGTGNGLSQGVVLIIAIAIVAGGMLFGMRQFQGDLTAGGVNKQAEAKIEEALTKWSMPQTVASDDPLAPASIEALFRETDSIISMLSSDFRQQHVPVEYVKKNPFTLKLAETATAAGPTVNKSARVEALKQDLRQFTLQTVMNGRVPIAVINGEMYRTGQQLGSFTIAKIDTAALTVTVTAEGHSFNLMMNEK